MIDWISVEMVVCVIIGFVSTCWFSYKIQEAYRKEASK